MISLHFFENHLVETFADSINMLVNLKHLSIFNGDVAFEGVPNRNANQVKKLPETIKDLVNLEELNLAYVGLSGFLPIDLTSLTKLKYINLSNNALEG